MKYLSKIILSTICIATFLAACDKADVVPFHSNGTAVVLKSSVTSLAPTATDSSTNVIAFSWTNPTYATDSAHQKFILELDSSGRNFSHEVTFEVDGPLNTSLTGAQINAMLLGWGFAFNKAYPVDIRVISSYANNNEQYKSNVITVQMSAYVIPPKVTIPISGQLFLVGDATQGGWNNPVPVPTQQFNEVDSVTYEGVFNLVGGNQYLLLPVNGDWGQKYAVVDNSISGLANGGSFQYYGPGVSGGDNFPAPATSGWYTIIINFQTGVFTVTPFTGTMPTNLYIVGSATAGGWNNPVPTPSQQFTQVNSCVFQITLPLSGGQQYLFLPVNGDWGNKYATASNPSLATGDSFGYNAANNFTGPVADGTYTIAVDFATSMFTVH